MRKSIVRNTAVAVALFLVAGLPLPSRAQSSPGLAVSLEAPPEEGSHVIHSMGGGPRVNVLIQNISNRPQRLLAEDDAFGFATVTLEVLAVNGKPLLEPLTIHRSPLKFNGKVTQLVTLQPRDILVRQV